METNKQTDDMSQSVREETRDEELNTDHGEVSGAEGGSAAGTGKVDDENEANALIERQGNDAAAGIIRDTDAAKHDPDGK